jgi:predicted DNA-binding transcriptional regulator AlpA
MPVYLNLQEVAAILRVHTESISRWVRAGKFPRPAVLGGRVHRWRQDVVQQFIDSAASQQPAE